MTNQEIAIAGAIALSVIMLGLAFSMLFIFLKYNASEKPGKAV